jgi:hypothetical protein
VVTFPVGSVGDYSILEPTTSLNKRALGQIPALSSLSPSGGERPERPIRAHGG